MPKHPTFEVEAWIPSERDARDGECEEWTEVILQLDSDLTEPVALDLTRAAGEAIISTLGDVMHRWAGKSIINHIWEELDLTMDELMAKTAEPDDAGYARGLAMALAYMYNPLNPDIEQVRADAVERWESRQPAEDDENPFA